MMVNGGLYDMGAACMGALAGATTVRSGPMRPRDGMGGKNTQRRTPFGEENNPIASTPTFEGGHRGGPKFTPQKNVADGRRGGKPLAKFLREGVLGAVVALVVAAWVAKPVSAIAPVKAVWWT